MNNKLAVLICLTLSALARTAPADPPPQPVTVAVLPFETSDEKLRGKGDEFATLLGAQLSANPELFTLERAELDKILSEHQLKLSGLTDPASAVQAGHMLGAKALITGRIIASGDSLVLVAKIMSVETSRVFGETTSVPKDASLEKPAAVLAEKVGSLIVKHSAVFLPPSETPEQRLTRLRKLIENKVPPSVRVTVTERDLHQVAADPAVETEIQKDLHDLGFEIVDASSGKEPDVTISGEAFSEMGARRGQLISARARVEIKAVRRSDGKTLAVDRETGVAVDIAESVAGKTALQNAAHSLIERVLPKIMVR